MRLFDLTRVAAQAEGVRLKQLLKRQLRRGAYAGGAGLLALFAAMMLHLTAFEFLVPAVGPGFAALIVLGFDVLLAAVLGFLATRDQPGSDEQEAEMISRRARAQIADTVSTFTILTPVARVAGAKGIRGALLTAAATQWLSKRKRR